MLLLRIALSVFIGFLCLAGLVVLTGLLSHNFAAEGADTVAARQVAVAYDWACPLVRRLDVEPVAGTVIIIGCPLLAYSLVAFLILTFLRFPRRRSAGGDVGTPE